MAIFSTVAAMLSGFAVAVRVKVATPKGARVTVVAIAPVPDGAAQLDPGVAAQVHAGKVRSAVSSSSTGSPATANALLLLVMVIV